MVVDGKRLYNVVTSKEELDAWVDETFVVVDVDNAAELFPNLYRTKQAILYLMPKSSEVIIRCPHERRDRVRMLFLMNNLFEILSLSASARSVQFRDEGKNLSPSFFVAANIPKASDAQIAKSRNEVTTFATKLPSIGLLVTNTSALPGKTLRATLAFSREEWAAIVTAAKARDFTVTHVFHAAFILATKRRGSGTQPYASFLAIDCRPRCTVPFNSNRHAMAAYHWGGPIAIAPTDFAGTAAEVGRKYREARADEDPLPGSATLLEMLTPAMSQEPPAGPPASSAASFLSSIGVLDSKLHAKYGAITMKDFWLADDNLKPEMEAFLWSWKGMIELSACYNEIFYGHGVVEKLLAVTKEILFDGLAIDIEAK